MEKTLEIKVTQATTSNHDLVNWDNIDFGKVFSDHMLICSYDGKEWGTPEVVPFGKMPMSPALSTLHYAQSIFEGMKAYKSPEGETLLFRPTKNQKRLNVSAERMCMPDVPEEIFMEGLKALLKADKNWVPDGEGSSLYIRPFLFATDEYIGVRPSETYKFMIFSCPVGKYYAEPVRVYVEKEFTRASPGGTGYAKAAGNYAAALYPAKLAQEKGYHQLMWTDSTEHKYVEESGTMNLMVVIDGKLITPPTSDTTLAGITRDSVLTVAKDMGIVVEERKITITEIIEAHQNGKLTEAFGTGTAATIAHICTIGHDGVDYDITSEAQWTVSTKIGQYLSDLRTGKIEDPYGWSVRV